MFPSVIETVRLFVLFLEFGHEHGSLETAYAEHFQYHFSPKLSENVDLRKNVEEGFFCVDWVLTSVIGEN